MVVFAHPTVYKSMPLLRELVTLEERTDKGPETVKVVLAKEAEEWSR